MNHSFTTMKKTIFTLALALALPLASFAQQQGRNANRQQAAGPQPIVIELWPNGAPNDNGVTGPEVIPDPTHVNNVSKPTLTVYPAEKPTGKIIIACPGGAYRNLAIEKEGHSMAKYFNHQGVTLAVLKYRLPNGHFETTMSDVLEAVKIMRTRAKEWGADPNGIGVMGCSAGGNLAIQAAVNYTGPENRPDFQVLLYCFTAMNPMMNETMFGKNASQETIDKYTVMDHVTKDTPPAFLACSADDFLDPFENSIAYFKALRSFKTMATLHVYPSGAHGWGFSDDFYYKREWTAELEKWLRTF